MDIFYFKATKKGGNTFHLSLCSYDRREPFLSVIVNGSYRDVSKENLNIALGMIKVIELQKGVCVDRSVLDVRNWHYE